MSARGQREFFAVRTLGEALSEFRPRRRTGAERIPLRDALGRVPAEPVLAKAVHPHLVARGGGAIVNFTSISAKVAQTGRWLYPVGKAALVQLTRNMAMDLAGEVRMGSRPEVEVRPGTAAAIATGAPLPPGADAVLMVEHSQAALPELVEVLRPVAPGDGMVRADEDAAPGVELATPRPQA